MATAKANLRGVFAYLAGAAIWLYLVTVCVSGVLQFPLPNRGQSEARAVAQADTEHQKADHTCSCEEFGSFAIAPPGEISVAATPEGEWLWVAVARGWTTELLTPKDSGGVQATGPPRVASLTAQIVSRLVQANAPPSEK